MPYAVMHKQGAGARSHAVLVRPSSYPCALRVASTRRGQGRSSPGNLSTVNMQNYTERVM
jgi:hypothetical protein